MFFREYTYILLDHFLNMFCPRLVIILVDPVKQTKLVSDDSLFREQGHQAALPDLHSV